MSLNNAITKATKLLAKHNHIEAIRLILANDLVWNNLEIHHDSVRNQLNAIALTEGSNGQQQYSAELYQTIFSILLFLAKRWPRNARAALDNVIISPISHAQMGTAVCTSKGFQYDIYEVSRLLQYKKNPTDREPFLPRDLKYLTAKLDIAPRTPEQIAKRRLIKEKAESNRHFKMMEAFTARFLVWNLGAGSAGIALLIPAIMNFLSPLFILSLLVLPVFVGIAAYVAVKDKFPKALEVKDSAATIAKDEILFSEVEKEEPVVSSNAIIFSALDLTEEPVVAVDNVVHLSTIQKQKRQKWLTAIEPELKKGEGAKPAVLRKA